MTEINKFLLTSLIDEVKLINDRVKFLEVKYIALKWDDESAPNQDKIKHLKYLIQKYKKLIKDLKLEILSYRFKDGFKDFNFAPYEGVIRTDTTTNYQM